MTGGEVQGSRGAGLQGLWTVLGTLAFISGFNRKSLGSGQRAHRISKGLLWVMSEKSAKGILERRLLYESCPRVQCRHSVDS